MAKIDIFSIQYTFPEVLIEQNNKAKAEEGSGKTEHASKTEEAEDNEVFDEENQSKSSEVESRIKYSKR